MKSEKGFSLIEVMVAIMVVAIGMIAIVSLQSRTLANSQDEVDKIAKVLGGYSALEALRTDRVGALSGSYNFDLPISGSQCIVPVSKTGLSNYVIGAWLNELKLNLGDQACGSIACSTTAECTIQITRDFHNSSASIYEVKGQL
jgi:type IV pilus assembly protein PilV